MQSPEVKNICLLYFYQQPILLQKVTQKMIRHFLLPNKEEEYSLFLFVQASQVFVHMVMETQEIYQTDQVIVLE